MAPGAERLEGGRAAVRAVSGRGAAEADGHLEAPGVRANHLRALPAGVEADSAVGHELDLHAVEPPRARDGVLRVPELEGAAPLREVRGRDARAEDVRPALRADLEDDVVVEGVHREAGAGEHGAQGEPGRRAVRVEAALLQLHGEGAGLEAARGILEVGEAVAVVVDAVAANLGRRRVGPEASSGVVDVGVNARAASAAVGGAGVVVVAVGDRRAEGTAGDRGVGADAADAGVVGAGVLVVAVGGGRAELAAGDGRVAAGARRGIAGARRVALVGGRAPDGVRAHAGAGRTGVGLRARVAVRAGRAIDLRGIAAGARRGIAGARRVALVGGRAHDGVRAHAGAGRTGVGLRARVAVRAGCAIDLRGIAAGARRGVAGSGGVALRGGGAHDGGGGNGATGL